MLADGSIITDRAVYKAEDTVHVKLYVRTQDGAALAVPEAAVRYTMEVRWSDGTDGTVTTAVQLDAGTGVFAAVGGAANETPKGWLAQRGLHYAPDRLKQLECELTKNG